MKFTAKLLVVSMVIANLGFAEHVYEDFESYSDGEYIGTHYLYTDSSGSSALGTTISDIGSTKAGYYNVDTNNIDTAPGDWLYVETTSLQESPAQDWMQYNLSFSVKESVATANPGNPTLIDSVWYYAYADTNSDGTDDKYYETLVTAAGDASTPLDSPDILQAYPKGYLQGVNASDWDEYDPDTLDPLGTTSGIPESALENLTEVGVQLRTTNFDPNGQTEFMTVWTDNVTVIPEPSTIFLLGAGLLALAGGRRRARRSRV